MKHYGSYAMFLPDTSKKDAEDALKRLCIAQLMDLGLVKIMVADDPTPYEAEDGSVSWVLSGGWKLDIPENECGGCQYWDGAACLNPMSKRYGRETDDGCDKWDGGQDDACAGSV